MEAFTLTVGAVYMSKHEKGPVLERVRAAIEKIKQLIRVAYEIKSLEERNYLRFAAMLQEISKMANGWIKYLNTQNPPTNRRM